MTTQTTLQLNHLVNQSIERSHNLPEGWSESWAAEVIEFGRKEFFVEMKSVISGRKRYDIIIKIQDEVVFNLKDYFVGNGWMANIGLIELIESELKSQNKR